MHGSPCILPLLNLNVEAQVNYCEFVQLRKHVSVVISIQYIVNNSKEY